MAARFWVGGGSSTNWSAITPTNWALTSGGANNVAVPTVSDDVTFDGVGASANGASVVSASISCLSLTFAIGYTNTVTINTGVILTIAGNFTDNTAHSWVVSGTGSITISAASTITSGGKTFPGPVAFSGSNTKTLAANWTITGTLTISSNTVITANTLSVGGLTMTGASSGTATISMSGGTWSGAGALSNSLTIAGNVTVSGSVAYNTGTLTYSSGTVTTTGSTVTIGLSSTFNTNGINWTNITIAGTVTLTINSLLTVTGTMLLSASNNVTFAGTAGFTVGTFSATGPIGATTYTFANTLTYTITTALSAFSSRVGGILLFTSDHATNTVNLTLNNGATCNVLASFTRINASGGRTIFTFNGVLTTTTNITVISDLTFVTGKSIVIQGNSNF